MDFHEFIDQDAWDQTFLLLQPNEVKQEKKRDDGSNFPSIQP